MDIIKIGYLMRTIVYNINSYLSLKLEPYGIGSGQFEYFMLIHINDGINQKRLADVKGVGKASVTKAVDILMGKGLVYRSINLDDKRNFSLHCTKKGKDIVADLLSYRNELESILFNDFSDAEKIELLDLMNKMKINTDLLGEMNHG